MKPSARSIAAQVLLRVEKDRAYAAASLDAEIERHPQLDARERALATELVYGVLRTQGALTERLQRHLSRPFEKTDPTVRAHLLVAGYQILLLDRVPPFAAVDSAVDLVRAARGEKLAGFANAVLRKLAASGEHLDRAQAAFASAPAWLRERLERDVGADETRALVAGAEPVVALRVRIGRELPSWLSDVEPGKVSPLARLLRAAGDPRKKPGWAEGAFVVQEEGAQLVALALGVRSGDRVLDACAGRGQKTTLFVEQGGDVVASDVHPHKLRALAVECERLGLPAPPTHAVDLSVGVGNLPDGFDRVLVDAPCSGVGTLARRPEIARRLGPDDPARLAELALKLLQNAATRARPGGRVVFAVCSVLAEEANPRSSLLQPAPFDAPEIVARFGKDATSFRLLPLRDGTDGYYVASFVRR